MMKAMMKKIKKKLYLFRFFKNGTVPHDLDNKTSKIELQVDVIENLICNSNF